MLDYIIFGGTGMLIFLGILLMMFGDSERGYTEADDHKQDDEWSKGL